METTLKRAVPAPDFGYSLAAYIQQFAEKTKDALGAIRQKHTAALGDLHNYVASLDVFDPTMVALYELHMRRGDTREGEAFSRWEFVPSENQQRVLALLGSNAPPPAPSVTLSELVTVGLIDTIGQMVAYRNETKTVEQEKAAVERDLEAEREAHAETRDLIASVEAARDQALAEKGEAQSEAQFLKSFIPNGETPKAPKESKPRRTKVEGHTGIYLAANGTDYEINYQDEGKTRWLTIGPEIDEAIAARKEAVEGVPA